MRAFEDATVEAVFNAYPQQFRKALLALREIIFEVAAETEGVGPLSEVLKWSQPSYLTEKTGSGTTVRLDRFGDSSVAVFFHCQTTLVETFRELFPELKYEKNRAIVLDPVKALPADVLAICIKMALTYKLKRK
ncbi:DUF1801 domain-containing protein [Microvirga sp. W0021]|uniref:DUF1801 domain-containing protein n=1 Tax=Hohaiivirga grylli TaxID=3133970 RepID=A0ABV0BLM5_9HYPH